LYPVLFTIWRRRHLPKATRDQRTDATHALHSDAPTLPPSSLGRLLIAVLIAAILAAGGYFAWKRFGGPGSSQAITGTPFATQTVNGLTITLVHPKGELLLGRNDFLIEFRDASAQLVDVGTVTFDLDMNMPAMVIHNSASIRPTSTPGQYRAS